MNRETEKVIISVTPDAIKHKGQVKRHSIGKVDVKTLPSPASSNDKLLPHYLRASTSSCHDHCKYGHKPVFQAKKRNPNFRRLSLNNDIQHEEQSKTEVSTVRVRSKRPELKLRTTLTQDKLPHNSYVIKQKTKKDIQLSDAIRNLEEGSSEDSDSIKVLTPSPFHESSVSLGHKPFSKGEDLSDVHKNIDAESYEESESIKRTSPSPIHESIAFLERKTSIEMEGLSDQPMQPTSIRIAIPSPEQGLELPAEPEAMELGTPSPVEKDILSHAPTPPSWSEVSSDRSMSMELEISSPVHMPANQVEGSSEVVTPLRVVESISSADVTTRSKLKAPSSVTKSLKPKTSLSTRKSFASTKLTPPSRAEKPSEVGQSVKFKASSADRRSFAENKEQTWLKSLKTGEGKKREMTKLKTGVLDRAEATKEKKVSVNGLKSLQISEGKIRKAMKLKIAPQLKKVALDRAEATRGKNVEVTGKPNVIKKTNPVEKTKRTVKLKLTEVKIPSSVKETVKLVPPGVKRMDVPARSSFSLKLKTPVVKSTSALVSSARLPAQRNQGRGDPSELGEEKALKPSRASLSSKTNGNGVSSMKSRRFSYSTPITPVESRTKVDKSEHNDAKTVPKAIKKPKRKKSRSSSETSSSTSSPSSVSSHVQEGYGDNESTLHKASELVVNDEETKRNEPVQPQKGVVDNQRSRRIATSETDDRHLSPHKLNFRRGKVVSPQSESSGPRKLRFWQAGAANDNHRGKEVGRQGFRKRRGSGGSVAELSTPVVLRHQGVQEKKEAQGLFNHVIEETASKLVETRKSKVKALVGAFETVISLQESRVTPSSLSCSSMS